MAISKLFFHVSTFVLFLSFLITSAHFQDVTPHKELDSKSSDSPSYAPSASPKSWVSSGSSTDQCSCTCPAPDASTGSASTSSSSGSGSSSGSFSGSTRFDASADSSFSGSSSGSGSVSGSSSSTSPSSSPSMGPSSSGSGSDSESGDSTGHSSSDADFSGSSSDSDDYSMGPSSSNSGSDSSSSSSDSSAPMGSSSSSGSDDSSAPMGSESDSSSLSGSDSASSPSMSPSSSMGPSSSGDSMSPDSSTSDSSSVAPMGSSSSSYSDAPTSSASMGPSSSNSDSESSAPTDSTSSDSSSDSSSSDGAGSDDWSSFSDQTGSDSSSGSGSGSGSSSGSGSGSASSPAYAPSSGSGSGDSTASGSTSGSISGSSELSGSGTFTASGSSQSSGSSTSDSSNAISPGGSAADSSGSGSGSSEANASASSGSSAEITASGSLEISFKFSGTFKKVFAFGDSYTDTGNAQILGIMKNFVVPFLTKVFQGINPNLNTAGRSSNGRLVIDFLCDALNISSLQPYKALSANTGANFESGVNFAVGGATSLSGDFFSKNKIGSNLQWQGVPPGFQTQADWYNDFLKQKACNGKSVEECKQEMGTHLIWLGQMGVDDYTRVLGSSISMRWLADVTITHISQILTTVLDSGAKNIVVQGLPPLGCIPVAKFFTPQFLKDEMGCSAIINKAVTVHNDLLQATLDQFRSRYPGSSIAYADYFNAYKTIVLNLGAYGFEDDSTACCGFGGGLLNFNLNILCGMTGTRPCSNPASHIHWDGIHLTEAMHKQITNLFLTKGFIKPSFDSLCSSKRPGN